MISTPHTSSIAPPGNQDETLRWRDSGKTKVLAGPMPEKQKPDHDAHQRERLIFVLFHEPQHLTLLLIVILVRIRHSLFLSNGNYPPGETTRRATADEKPDTEKNALTPVQSRIAPGAWSTRAPPVVRYRRANPADTTRAACLRRLRSPRPGRPRQSVPAIHL